MRFKASISRKMTQVIMLTTTTVLFLTCAILLIYEAITYRKSLTQDVATIAKITAANSTAALAFENEKDANETLAALRSERNILQAAIYDNQNRLFAKLSVEPFGAFPTTPISDGAHFKNGRLNHFEPIVQSPNRLGTLYLQSNLSPIYARLRLYSEIMGIVLIGATLLAYFLSTRLQKSITQPILELAEVARRVSEAKDYSARATRYTEDELGALTDTLNHRSRRGRRSSKSPTRT